MLNIVKNDPWLEPFEEAINARHSQFIRKEKELTKDGESTLTEFASGHQYFGMHKQGTNWVLREWAPNATDIFLIGTFNEWRHLDRKSVV